MQIIAALCIFLQDSASLCKILHHSVSFHFILYEILSSHSVLKVPSLDIFHKFTVIMFCSTLKNNIARLNFCFLSSLKNFHFCTFAKILLQLILTFFCEDKCVFQNMSSTRPKCWIVCERSFGRSFGRNEALNGRSFDSAES